MHAAANEAGYPNDELGIYLQPIVQGVNCHCEFNLFYDSENPGEIRPGQRAYSQCYQMLGGERSFFFPALWGNRQDDYESRWCHHGNIKKGQIHCRPLTIL